MADTQKYSLLRNILKTFGLSNDAVDDIIDFINSILKDKEAEKHDEVRYPYKICENFLSPAEMSFFKVLQTSLNGSLYIFTKVSLGDLFYTTEKDPGNFRAYRNRIDRKHIDFLLCDPITMRPIVALELDDKSHQRPDRQERDDFVDHVFSAASLPLVHVPAQRAYTTEHLMSLVAKYIQHAATAPKQAAAVTGPIEAIDMKKNDLIPDYAPACPKCGKTMILRTAKNGPNAGKQFWGCPGYPQCRGIIEINIG